MYNPQFLITPKITLDLEKLGAVFGYFQATRLPKNYKKELVSKITAETVHASTAIEGNTLTQRQVGDILSGKQVTAQAREIKEVENYNRALNHIKKLNTQEDFRIREQTIKGINRTLLKDVDDKIAGQYRTRQVYVGDYLPPEHFKIPGLMRHLIEWLNDPEPKNLSPILYAGIAHYQLVAIHPFEDGNGRTARVLTTLTLIQNGYDMMSFFALESYYNRDRKAYYEALSSADKYQANNQPDLTRWLEYFVWGILIEAEKAKSNIEELVQKKDSFGNRVYLSNIQLKLLKLATEKDTIKIADALKASGLSRKGSYNALQKLVEFRLLERVGVKKGAYYKITGKSQGYLR